MSSRQEQEIEDLQGEIAKRDARIVELKEEVLVERDSVQGYLGRINRLRAELAAIKAQEPVGFADITLRSFAKYKSAMHCLPLYAAPVSEAQAQGVVMPEQVLSNETLWDIRNHVACNEVLQSDDSLTICVKHGRAIEAAVLARLNAFPVQQVSVPDGWKLAPVEPTYEMLGAALMNQVECLDAIEVIRTDYKAMLAAAPAPGGE